ncbi:MAG: MATE family efflux transporter [Gallionella sp.]|nr:MATE family efflux transporter [Gallionella sp.]
MKWDVFWRAFLPMLLTFGVAQLVLQVDLVMLSRLGASATVACIAIIRIALLDMMLMIAVGSVTSVLVSQARQEGNVNIVVQYALSTAAILGGVAMVVGWLCYPHLATWLVGRGEVSTFVQDAVFWYSLGAPFRVVAATAIFTLHALGEGQRVVIWKCIELLLKISLNTLLIFTLALGFKGSYIASLIVTLVTCSWSLHRLHQQMDFQLRLPEAAWLRDFLRKVGWEAQRLLSAQLFALLTLALFASSYFAPTELARLSAYTSGTALMMLLSAPLVALMRSLAFQLAGCSPQSMLSALKVLAGVGLPLVMLVSIALYFSGDYLGKVLYGQQNDRWWSPLILVLALSLPLRFFNNLQRALLQARQAFASVARMESVVTWGLDLPLIMLGLYLNNPLLTYSHVLLSELFIWWWMRRCLLPLHQECRIEVRTLQHIQ